MFKGLYDKIFRTNLQLSAMKSIINMQRDQIEELTKDKTYYRNLYEELKNTPIELPPIEISDDPEDWKPLKTGAEIPSAKRARLEKRFRELAKEKRSKHDDPVGKHSVNLDTTTNE